MAKNTTHFVCQACGASSPRWLGRCPGCSAWNTLVEERKATGRESGAGGGAPVADYAGHTLGKVVPLVSVTEDVSRRLPTGIGELDRVLGGGVVPGSVVLLGGDPGVGKSTLLLQALAGLGAQGAPVLYASGEESIAQVALRARRLGLQTGPSVQVVGVSDVAEIEEPTRKLRPVAVVIDSVQVLRSSELESAPGTVSQLREVTARLVELAKRTGAALFLVGHVTKDGALAGPKVLEHLVDVVLSFEGDRGHTFRALRASKNRFGSANEVGVFEMSPSGLVEVPNPSELFLAERPAHAAGSVVAAVTPQEGSARAILVEVQALVGVSGPAAGRRVATGLLSARFSMVLAVLERKVGITLAGADVFANVAGGLAIEEPALDLPLAIAVASAARNRPCARDLIAFGEIGLASEVRGVARVAARLSEASSMGFARAIVPASTASRVRDDSNANVPQGTSKSPIELLAARTVEEAIELALSD